MSGQFSVKNHESSINNNKTCKRRESMTSRELCPDCFVHPGSLHHYGCDIERCRECGFQLLTCGCTINEAERLLWTGEWPGLADCRELGFYLKIVTDKEIYECDKDTIGAEEDLNRLARDGVWSKEQGRYVR
jgi:hypothetical protein